MVPQIALSLPSRPQPSAQVRYSAQNSGTRRNRGIGLKNIRPGVQTRCRSIRSVMKISRPSKSWWCSARGGKGIPATQSQSWMLVSRCRSSSFATQAVTCRPAAAKSPDSLRYDAGNSDRSWSRSCWGASVWCSFVCSRSLMENGGAWHLLAQKGGSRRTALWANTEPVTVPISPPRYG